MDGSDSEERGRALVQTLAVVVESMVRSSAAVPMAYYQKTKFEAFRAPGISIRDYLLRIHKYASCSPECFVLALVYIDRLHQLHGFVLTELNVHRVLISSIVLAAKFFDDHYFNNAYYAKVGGVPCPEMNELEVEFLLLINFSLHVCTDTYTQYYNELANHYIFTSVRNASGPAAAPYRQLRHFVTNDPSKEGQLVYVTEGASSSDTPPAPAPAEPLFSRKRVERDGDMPSNYVTGHSTRSRPAGHSSAQYPLHQPPPPPSTQSTPFQSFHPVRHSHHRYVYEESNCTPSMTDTSVFPAVSRSSTSQKRRNVVALGVNA